MNIDHYLAAQDGKLACERIVDVLEEMVAGSSASSRPGLFDRLEGWSIANGRRLVKGVMSHFPNSHNRAEFQRHRFPGISLDALNSKVEHIQQILGDTGKIRVEALSDVIFRIGV